MRTPTAKQRQKRLRGAGLADATPHPENCWQKATHHPSHSLATALTAAETAAPIATSAVVLIRKNTMALRLWTNSAKSILEFGALAMARCCVCASRFGRGSNMRRQSADKALAISTESDGTALPPTNAPNA